MMRNLFSRESQNVYVCSFIANIYKSLVNEFCEYLCLLGINLLPQRALMENSEKDTNLFLYLLLGEGNLSFCYTCTTYPKFRQIKKNIIFISHIKIFLYYLFFF